MLTDYDPTLRDESLPLEDRGLFEDLMSAQIPFEDVMEGNILESISKVFFHGFPADGK